MQRIRTLCRQSGLLIFDCFRFFGYILNFCFYRELVASIMADFWRMGVEDHALANSEKPDLKGENYGRAKDPVIVPDENKHPDGREPDYEILQPGEVHLVDRGKLFDNCLSMAAEFH